MEEDGWLTGAEVIITNRSGRGAPGNPLLWRALLLAPSPELRIQVYLIYCVDGARKVLSAFDWISPSFVFAPLWISSESGEPFIPSVPKAWTYRENRAIDRIILILVRDAQCINHGTVFPSRWDRRYFHALCPKSISLSDSAVPSKRDQINEN